MTAPEHPARGWRSRLPGVLRRERRPTLIILVYSACMVLVGITASAQAGVISTSYQRRAIEAVVQDDAALIRAVVNSEVRLSDLPPTGPTPERREELSGVLARLASRGGTVGSSSSPRTARPSPGRRTRTCRRWPSPTRSREGRRRG